MFVRVKSVQANGRHYRYLQIVENFREGDRVRQRILGSLGRLDELLASGDLERVITQLAEQCPSVRVQRAEQAGTLAVVSDRCWGPVLVFDRLWEELGLKALLRQIGRGVEFDFERMIFAQVLQRFCEPGSDLRGSKWIQTVHEPAFAQLSLEHFYRSLGRLWKHKQRIELALYERGRDLFNGDLDLAFFDTTSTYFEGTSLKGWARLGKSKDHRPDHLQLVVGVVMRRDGLPVACEIWPGNTADVNTLVPIVRALKKRFRIAQVVLVCDRGMVSAANLAGIEQAGFQYIVGMKMRNLVEVRDEVLGRAGRYHEVSENLRVKEVHIDERRYVVCFNPDEAAKDRADRQATIEKIRAKLAKGGLKQLIANRGYKRYLRVQRASAAIDEARVKQEERYDGKYVLRTTTELPAEEIALAYKHLTWIERLWRDLKDVVELRPIFHLRLHENVRGHIFVCFLSLYLAALLKRRLAQAELKPQWDEIMRDLSALRAVTVDLGDEQYLLRSPLQGSAGKILTALGIKPPPVAQPASR